MDYLCFVLCNTSQKNISDFLELSKTDNNFVASCEKDFDISYLFIKFAAKYEPKQYDYRMEHSDGTVAGQRGLLRL